MALPFVMIINELQSFDLTHDTGINVRSEYAVSLEMYCINLVFYNILIDIKHLKEKMGAKIKQTHIK